MTTKTTCKYMITTILLITATLLLQSCNKPTEPAKESISVTVEDVSCTEAWLKISDTNANPNITIIVKRDDTDILTLNLNKADTVIVDENLLPSKTYTYSAVKQQGSNVVEASKPVTAVTLDTTSHNFTWQTFEFGEHGNSVLYDVAIIDENNIWAVGEIYMKDSLGNDDPHAYNAVHWNGQKWELKKISVLFRGNIITPPLEGVFAFSGNDIWFVGSLPIHGDGNNWTMYDLRTTVNPNLSLSKAWGISSNNIYFVGNNGNIAHWDGSSWKKIESGTEFQLTDIAVDKYGEIYVSGIKMELANGLILKGNKEKGFSIIVNSSIVSANDIFKPNLFGELQTVWIDENGTVYSAGNMLYWYKNGKWDYVKNLPENYIDGDPGGNYRGFINSISGNRSNDYVIAGDRNTLRHYNGKRWTQLGIPYGLNTGIRWFKACQKDGLIVAIGYKNNNAFIIKLKR